MYVSCLVFRCFRGKSTMARDMFGPSPEICWLLGNTILILVHILVQWDRLESDCFTSHVSLCACKAAWPFCFVTFLLPGRGHRLAECSLFGLAHCHATLRISKWRGAGHGYRCKWPQNDWLWMAHSHQEIEMRMEELKKHKKNYWNLLIHAYLILFDIIHQIKFANVNFYIDSSSGCKSYKARAHMARVLALETIKVLVLDEFTSLVDRPTAKRMAKGLQNLLNQRSKSWVGRAGNLLGWAKWFLWDFPSFASRIHAWLGN